MSEDLAWKSAAKLVRGYHKKKFSPVEVAKACLARIEKHEAALNAMSGIHADEALSQAKASEARWLKGKPQGPVDGVPVLVKDLLLVKGWKTLRGSKTVDPDQPWDNDAPSVAEIMEMNFRFNLSLEEYASLCHRSLSTFKRDFQTHFEESPGKWLLQKRLDYSAALIRNSKMNMTEIAFESGFEDVSHFSRVFKERFNVSPMSYRQTAPAGK